MDKDEILHTKRTDSLAAGAEKSKLMKGICIGLALAQIAETAVMVALIRRETTLIPYVVEIDRSGDVKYIENAAEKLAEWKPSVATEIKVLSDYLVSLRGISTDPDIQRERIRNVYAFSTENALKNAEKYLLDTRPLDRMENERAEVKVYAATPLIDGKDDLFQLDWNEKTFSLGGNLKDEKNYRAIISTKHFSPRTKSVQETNPLGIYVRDIRISEIRDGYVIYD